MKIKESHKRDYDFYLAWNKVTPPIIKLGEKTIEIPLGPNSPLIGFVELESHGKLSRGVTNPQELLSVLSGKRSINFHITDLWSPGFYDVGGLQWWSELEEEFADKDILFPRNSAGVSWIYKNLMNSIKKLYSVEPN